MAAVQRGGAGRLLHAEEEKHPRPLLLVFGKVLRRHDGLDQDRIVHGVEHGVKLLHQLARVAHARIAHLALYVDLRAGGRLQSLHERGDLMAEGAVEIVAEHAQRAADGDILGDDVVRRAALDLAEREQCVLMRVNVMTVCTIVISSAATTMASMPICGVDACALLPCTVISKSLVCAMR